MAENLYHLLNLLLATDGRRQLVLSGKAIQRDAEMFQIRRQLEFLLVLLLFLFAYEYARSYVLHNSLRVRAEIPQHLDEQSSLVLREGQKNICRFDGASPLCASALHRTLEEVGRIGGYFESFADMLPTHFQTLLYARLD